MKTKNLVLVAFLVVAIPMVLIAQDKYEYASVTCRFYGNTKAFISISKQGKFEQNEVKISEGVAGENLVPIIEIVNKMNKEGWEVYANNASGLYIYYSLHKKLN